ncbi:hypothetical protein GJ744_003699 [Endocarpon pusillum]|uniref:Peptidase S8/S53 domain-containing protein n=1 Tax=Endocarpon pusillum TaxID=364733 RepID=A0A8H7DZL4_9EURO|nr:hypothetical protein GJ744_003699 [Endocarpon pusillum]
MNERITLHATHADICKFPNGEDPNLRVVGQEMARLVDNATRQESEPDAAQDTSSRAVKPSMFENTKATEKVFTGSDVAEAWFAALARKCNRSYGSYKDGHVRVKVAIIDTGIDASHPLLKIFEENGQIRCKGWIDGEPANTDDNGHGTHVAHSLLKVASRAELYIAKVFKQVKKISWNKTSV